MPRSSLQRLLRLGGTLTVLAVLGFLLLPAFVVVMAAFNASALPSFPPQAGRCDGLPRRLPIGTFGRDCATA